MRYIAGKVIKVGDTLRKPGEEVPEANTWHPMALRASLGIGEIVEVLADGSYRADVPERALIAINDYSDPATVAVDPLAQRPSPSDSEALLEEAEITDADIDGLAAEAIKRQSTQARLTKARAAKAAKRALATV